MKRGLWIAAGAGGALLLLLAAWLWSGLNTPARAASDEVAVFEVDSGETLLQVADRLDSGGFLPRRTLFGPAVLVGWARLRGVDREIKSGEYDLEPSLTPRELLEKFVTGSVKTHAVTLPEGLRLDEVAARLEAAGIAPAGAFLARARDASFARSLGIEEGDLEGYLYPETYRFRRRSQPDEIIRRMYQEHQTRWSDADREALARSGLSVHEVVTLASIVEKETGVAEERPLVASVFWNRLHRGMRLESDPTTIYGIADFDGNLRREHLEDETNPWNTYKIAGLPPTPIANPGFASLAAVVRPAETDYLYFVSRGDGTHVFASSYDQHLMNVARYQRRSSSR
jgi:UPF0755 protein